MDKIITLNPCLSFHIPGRDAYYRGTRFDYSGIFSSLTFQGTEMTGEWFERYDPFMHDAVKGPSEEFTPTGFDQCAPDEGFLKIGVGVLRRPDDAPYDRFRLYEIIDPGTWEVETTPDTIIFRHTLDHAPWHYTYIKEIRSSRQEKSSFSFTISHSLINRGTPLAGEVYNHNFFTFGRLETTPDREIDFGFRPEGTWRAVYDSVGLTDGGIRFTRPLVRGQSVYMGDLHAAGSATTPYDIRLRERSNGREVRISSDAAVSRIVFWSNHRIACIEPYTPFEIKNGETFSLAIRYQIA